MNGLTSVIIGAAPAYQLVPYFGTDRYQDQARSGALRRGDPIDLCQLLGRELEVLQRSDVLLELLDAARADQRGGDARVAERPRERELGQSLSSAPGDLVQRPDLAERLLVEPVGRQRVAAAGARILRHAVQVAVGQQSLRERREDDAADPGALARVEHARLDPAVEDVVRRLVDHERRV